MLSPEEKSRFHDLLFQWYLTNKRPLPWRGNTDPYIIWVAEIIFQQTRIEQGINYFRNFITSFPDIETLAAASEDEVLKVWQGLGYYSRARNLRTSAQMILRDHHGLFPNKYEAIIRLKGIGDYSASAIASISFGAPHAAVDGNVQRIISRLFAISADMGLAGTQKVIREIAQALLCQQHPGDFNEAMMDLGALVCKPSLPLCVTCPVSGFCQAFRLGNPQVYPVRQPKPAKKRRILNYFIISVGTGICLQRRDQTDIWQGLYEMPMVEGILRESELTVKLVQLTGCQKINIDFIGKTHHLLTHQELRLNFYRCHLSTAECQGFIAGLTVVHRQDYPRYAMPKPIASFLDQWLEEKGWPI